MSNYYYSTKNSGKFDFGKLQDEVFKELNKLRTSPKSYIPLLEEQMKKLKGKILIRPNQAPIQTVEGQDAYIDAIEFLSEQNPVEPLIYDKRLSFAANDLANDIGPKGLVSHKDSKGDYCSERIEKYCEWDYCANECLEVGSFSATNIIIDLLVDDGIFERQDRRALFQHIYNYIGIGCGPHREFGIITILIFTGGIRPKGTLFYQYDTSNEYYVPEPIPKYNIKNNFQISDPDAPDNTVSIRVSKGKKLFQGKYINVTKKFYSLDDGTEHIVEIEEY